MGCWSWVDWDASSSENTHECNDIDWCDAVVQVAFALLWNEEISALLPVTDGWVAIMPRHIDLSRNLLKPERPDLLEIRLHSFVGEVFRVCPVEKINVEIERLGRRTPISVTFRSWLKRYLLWKMEENSRKCFDYITSAFSRDKVESCEFEAFYGFVGRPTAKTNSTIISLCLQTAFCEAKIWRQLTYFSTMKLQIVFRFFSWTQMIQMQFFEARFAHKQSRSIDLGHMAINSHSPNFEDKLKLFSPLSHYLLRLSK